ncbi:hypothetical protein B0H14DRAFT_2567445 [Mycena olivaceomarginata]|nr:hypothetical protein B0H14DRAFT_2567445 [Mycena olivaceomarginata]
MQGCHTLRTGPNYPRDGIAAAGLHIWLADVPPVPAELTALVFPSDKLYNNVVDYFEFPPGPIAKLEVAQLLDWWNSHPTKWPLHEGGTSPQPSVMRMKAARAAREVGMWSIPVTYLVMASTSKVRDSMSNQLAKLWDVYPREKNFDPNKSVGSFDWVNKCVGDLTLVTKVSLI